MVCCVMVCYVLSCSVLLFCVLSCSSRARGGIPGTLGTTGDLAAAVCRVGGPGGLFLKSNNPNLSGGEMLWCVLSCSVLSCYVLFCHVCSVMLCSVMLCYV